MVLPAADALYNLAADLLDRVVDIYTQAGITLPESQYVAPGDSGTIAYDIESVMVTLDWIGTGQPGVDRTGTENWPTTLQYGQFSVTVLRDAVIQQDDGSPPTVAAIQADALTNMKDGWILQAALETIRNESRQPGGWAKPGQPMALGRVQTVGPQGAMMAVVGWIQVGFL